MGQHLDRAQPSDYFLHSSGIKVAGVLICKVHHSFIHMFGTLAEVAERLTSAGTGVPSMLVSSGSTTYGLGLSEGVSKDGVNSISILRSWACTLARHHFYHILLIEVTDPAE